MCVHYICHCNFSSLVSYDCASECACTRVCAQLALPMECLAPSAENVFYAKQLLFLVLPIAFIAVFLLSLGVFLCCYRRCMTSKPITFASAAKKFKFIAVRTLPHTCTHTYIHTHVHHAHTHTHTNTHTERSFACTHCILCVYESDVVGCCHFICISSNPKS